MDLRIHALTTILSILEPQASSPTKCPSIAFKVAVHIATLLTRRANRGAWSRSPGREPSTYDECGTRENPASEGVLLQF